MLEIECLCSLSNWMVRPNVAEFGNGACEEVRNLKWSHIDGDPNLIKLMTT
jgi:hypothetical protein